MNAKMAKHRLVSLGEGHGKGWDTRRYEIEGDPETYIELDPTFETECDGEHPHKERVDKIRARYTDEAAFNRYMGSLYNAKRITRKTDEGWVEYVTYQCPGGEIHNYSQWTVSVGGDWTENVYDRFSEARGALEAIIGPTVLVRAKAKPKQPETIEDASTGRRRWAVCGHPAEYDIDMHCYVCHGNVS